MEIPQGQAVNISVVATPELLEKLVDEIWSRKLENQRNDEIFLDKQEVMALLHIKAEKALWDKVRNKEFNEYGVRPKLYKKSEILAYLERTKTF